MDCVSSLVTLQVAYVAAMAGEHVAFFSLEMPVEQLVMRAQSSLSGVPLRQIKRPGLMEDSQWADLTAASAALSKAAIAYVDMPGMTVTDIRAKARQLHRDNPLKLIVIDYLQLIPGRSRNDNRNTEIEQISRGIKQLARELDCPVMCLSQLNRSLETRNDKRPLLSDLRDSGSIEQDADLVLFLYRDDEYHEDSPHAGIAEIILRKHRNGETGQVDSTWYSERLQFLDYSGPNRAEREPKKKRGANMGIDY